MKRNILKTILWCSLILLCAACQPDSYRKVYPEGKPELTAQMLTPEVQYGQDSLAFSGESKETQTPLSTLRVKVLVGMNVCAKTELRTRDYH